MSDTMNTLSDSTGNESKRWRAIAVILLVVIAAVAAFFIFGGNDGDETGGSVPTSQATETTVTSATTEVVATTEPVATTEAPASTEPTTTAPTTTVPPAPDATREAVWPWADTTTRYADPVEAALGFATDYLGFVEPIAGEFQAGDSRSGEVEIRAIESGPPTVVLVRQLTADDSWWILGAASENITVDEPVQGAEVTSPVTVSGSAFAFEGTVAVQLRADDNGEPIFEGYVTGGGSESLPFSDSFAFDSPGTTSGALVMLSRSPKDGSTFEASVLRIFYR